MTLGRIIAELHRVTPADSGAVTLEPTVPVLRHATGLYLLAQTVRLSELAVGRVLQATDDPGLTPSPWQWRATFNIPGLPLAPVIFDLPAMATVDLFDLVSLALAPSVVEVVSDADRRRAEAAADRAAAEADRAEAAAASAGNPGGGTTIPGNDGKDGKDGSDGREVELRATSTDVEWRYLGDTGWVSLVPLSALRGADGEDGADGDDGDDGADALQVELQATATMIQWRRSGQPWVDLVPLATLKGGKGDTGQTGPTGPQGPAGNVRLLAAGATSGPTTDPAGTLWVYRA